MKSHRSLLTGLSYHGGGVISTKEAGKEGNLLIQKPKILDRPPPSKGIYKDYSGIWRANLAPHARSGKEEKINSLISDGFRQGFMQMLPGLLPPLGAADIRCTQGVPNLVYNHEAKLGRDFYLFSTKARASRWIRRYTSL